MVVEIEVEKTGRLLRVRNLVELAVDLLRRAQQLKLQHGEVRIRDVRALSPNYIYIETERLPDKIRSKTLTVRIYFRS